VRPGAADRRWRVWADLEIVLSLVPLLLMVLIPLIEIAARPLWGPDVDNVAVLV